MNTFDLVTIINHEASEVGEGVKGDQIDHRTLMQKIGRAIDAMNNNYNGVEHPLSELMSRMQKKLSANESPTGRECSIYEFGDDEGFATGMLVYADLQQAISIGTRACEINKEVEQLRKENEAMRKALDFYWLDSHNREGYKMKYHDGSINDYLDWYKRTDGGKVKKPIDDLPPITVESGAELAARIEQSLNK